MRVMLAIDQWRAGDRHVRTFEGRQALRGERIVERLRQEIRRRVGSGFSVAELVELYDTGVSWALAIAAGEAPDDPDLWDGRVVDAAFHRQLGAASDWAGGRIVVQE